MIDEITSYVADMAEIEQLRIEILSKIHELKYGLHKDEDDLVIVISVKHYSLLFKYCEENNKWLSLDEERTKTTMFDVLLKQGLVERPVVGLR